MPSEWEHNSPSSSAKVSSSSGSSLSASSSTATSPEPNSNGNNNNNDSAKNGHAKDCALKASTMSHDPTPYVARARVTRPTPPKPSCNPMQFVQIKPCNLYQSAQQQLKKVEEIKKVKEVLKEEPEDWQNNLDNWKSCRRKRVEHIIERVVEVKKLELEEYDRTRRKSKTFSEMMEERGERGRTRPKLQSLASYNEDEANDLSDLGIGTSSASGKSSISEDCEMHSIVSEPPVGEQISSFDIEKHSCQPSQDNHNVDRISLLGGYETSSTAPFTSPDPYEYTYEGAIEDYKSRVSKASSVSSYKKAEFDRKLSSINDYDNDIETSVITVKKEDLPKIDISKKREIFEKQEVTKVSPIQNHEQIEKKRIPEEFANVRSIKDRLCSLEKKPAESNLEEQPSATAEILPGETYSIKERLECLNQHNAVNPKPNINKVVAEVVAVPPLKDRLSSLQNAVTKEETVKKPVVLVDEYQLLMLKNEDMARRQLETSKDDNVNVEKAPSDDSGINTTDEKIDQEPATTEDEDDDDDDVTIAMTAPIPSKNEEKLKNLNTPTVVSLVDKPVVVNDDHDDGGGDGGVGKTSFNSSKVFVSLKTYDNNDEVCEVNHAQNLLKMFKLAFNNENDVIEEIVKSNQIEVELDTVGPGVECGNTVTVVKLGTEIQKEDDSVLSQKALKAPQIGRDEVVGTYEKSPTSMENKVAKKILLKEVSAVDEIKYERLKASIDEKSKFLDLKTIEKIPPNGRFSPRAPEYDLNVVLNIENSQKNSSINSGSSQDDSNSENSVSSKIQQLNSLTSDSLKRPSTISDSSQKAQNIVTPVNCKTENQLNYSSPIPTETSSLSHDSSQSPPKFISVSSKVQHLNNLSAVSRKSPQAFDNSQKLNNAVTFVNSKVQRQLNPSSPIAQETPSLSNDQNPIYENIECSHPNPCVGLKKLFSPQSTGRVEIFNSKSMSEKPKSPDVLPKLSRSHQRNLLSNDFQQSALNDYINDLETSQQKTVEESVSKNNSKIIQETCGNPSIISKSLKEHVAVNKSKNLNEHTKALQTKPIPLPRNIEKSTPQPTSPLPFDSCVDILQTFLATECSSNLYPNESTIVKISNEPNSHPSDSFIRQESVVDVPCSKLDVKDLPDPNFIPTPCISVDCDERIARESIRPPQAQAFVRDSISSAGDSSPSSDITVIFKSAPESPTPNKSSLMEIANRMGSPIAARRDPLARQKPVCEKPCLKLDVKDLPDPHFIRTESFEVDKNDCRSNSPLTPSTPGLALHKTNAEILKKTCNDLSTSPPLSPVLGGRNAENPNFMIARVEVVETKIKVTTTNDAEAPTAVPITAPPSKPLGSPKPKAKSTQNSKPKNIFEFLKKNFQSKPDIVSEADEFEPISVDNSMFYVPSDVISASSGSIPIPIKDTPPVTSTNGVNIEITKIITSDAIVEQTDSDLNLTNKINDILDEEISKLVVEDAKL